MEQLEAIEILQKRIANSTAYLKHTQNTISDSHKEGVQRGIELDTLCLLALQERIPRVLTEEEILAIKPPRVLWMETRAFNNNTGTYYSGIDPVLYDGSYYTDANVRYWLAEPTAEQMEATTWLDSRGKVGKGHSPAQSDGGACERH